MSASSRTKKRENRQQTGYFLKHPVAFGGMLIGGKSHGKALRKASRKKARGVYQKQKLTGWF